MLQASANASCIRLHCASSGAGNDYQKDRQFRKLNAQRDVFEVKVLRGGQTTLISNLEVVVGDILVLDTGDKACVLVCVCTVQSRGRTWHVSGSLAAPSACTSTAAAHALPCMCPTWLFPFKGN